jgi:YebC/PmpR family DNA-binding regulatory protein
MAGHNRWSKIRHIKGAEDIKRSNVFSKISLRLTTALKRGAQMDSLEITSLLKEAKRLDIPKSTIDAAIKKAAGKSGDVLNSVVYQAMSSQGVALVIEGLTDKPARTSSYVKNIIVNDFAGTMTEVMFNFEKTSSISFVGKDKSLEKMLESAIDAGAADIEEELDEGQATLYCPTSQLMSISDALEAAGYEVTELSVSHYRPINTVSISDEAAQALEKLLVALDELDDVTKVSTNAEYPENV